MKKFTFKPFITLIGFAGACLIAACSKKPSNPPSGPVSTAKVSTFAGSIVHGNTDGTGTTASFNTPSGMVIDTHGNFFVTDENNNLVRKITPAGVVTTVAGNGASGSLDGTGTGAGFSAPQGLGIDAGNNLYVVDILSNKIRKITPAGVVTTFAGSGANADVDGIGTAASFHAPYMLTVDPSGNVYVSDRYTIRKITPGGVVSTFAGTGSNGLANGTGTAAGFSGPAGLASDKDGNIYVADAGNNTIRKITPAGLVTTLAGSGVKADADGTGTDASFNAPLALATDAQGNVYVGNNNLVRKITPSGVVTTVAGNTAAGFADGIGTAAKFDGVNGIVVDANGNLYVADAANNLIRKIVL
jgi:sugar lactone lactonase YvrE